MGNHRFDEKGPWYVNAPGAKSPTYATRARAEKAASSIRGARVSKRSRTPGAHTQATRVSRDGRPSCLPVAVGLLGAVGGVFTALGYGLANLVS